MVNLGWKLAAAVGGRVPAGLLDTYATERMPQAAEVLRQTLEQAALLAPGAEADAARRQFAAWIATPAGLRHVVNVIAGTAVAYEMPGVRPDPPVGLLAPDRTVRSSHGRTRAGRASTLGAGRAARPDPGSPPRRGGWRPARRHPGTGDRLTRHAGPTGRVRRLGRAGGRSAPLD